MRGVAIFVDRYLPPRRLLIGALLIISVKILLQLLHPVALPWDAAVYTGMGTYLATLGKLGLWEWYRPPLLPLLVAIGPTVGISVLVWSKALTVLAALGTIILIFIIGEHQKRYVGGLASLLLALTPFFTDFATVPTTEVFGVFGFLLAFYLIFSRQKLFLGGMVTAALFVLRFPYALILPLFGVYILLHLNIAKLPRRIIILKFARYVIGAFLVLGTYLVSNAYFHGDAIQPILDGNRIVSSQADIYTEPWYYYIGILLLACPFLVFAVVRKERRRAITFIMAHSALAFLIYFTANPHKDDRYIIPALPGFLLLATLGLVYVHEKKAFSKTLFLPVIAILLSAQLLVPYRPQFRAPYNPEQVAIYKQFQQYPGTIVLTSTPILAAYAPVKLFKLYINSDDLQQSFARAQGKAEMFYLNSCDLLEPPQHGLMELAATYGDIMQYQRKNSCEIIVGKMK